MKKYEKINPGDLIQIHDDVNVSYNLYRENSQNKKQELISTSKDQKHIQGLKENLIYFYTKIDSINCSDVILLTSYNFPKPDEEKSRYVGIEYKVLHKNRSLIIPIGVEVFSFWQSIASPNILKQNPCYFLTHVYSYNKADISLPSRAKSNTVNPT